MNCQFCGAELPEGAEFCPECGKKQVMPAAPAEAVTAEENPAEAVTAEEIPAEESLAKEAAVDVIAAEGPTEEPTAEESPAEEAASEEPAAEETAEEVTAEGTAAEGAAVEWPTEEKPAEETPSEETPAEEAAGEATAPAKKKGGKGLVIGILVAALALAGGIGYGVHMSNLKKGYEAAQVLYEEGKYAEAAEAFAALGKYQDSAAMAEKAGLWDAAEKAYDAAGTDAAAWDKAADAYDLLEEAEAAALAADCRNRAVYYRADARLAEGPEDPAVITEALEMYRSCGGVLDSADMITECENRLVYLSAVALMGEKKWEDAAAALQNLADNFYRDSSDLLLECNTRTAYASAEKLLKDKKYYDAYKKFMSLKGKKYEGMEDPEKKAKSCIQKQPSAGEVYHNPSYSNNNVQLTIDNKGFMNSFVKLIIGDDLVVSVFIPADGKVSFWLPSGTYKMKRAYGENWFGTTDLFGDEGYYWTCKFGGKESFTLENGYAYTISTGGEGTGISNSATGRGSF